MPADPNATNVAVATQPPLADAPPAAGGRYSLGDEIARGGMGAVFRATDTVLGREVAVKVLQERFAPDGGTARRFADEARIAAQLQHPGIPPVHDFGTLPDGRPFLAMKLIKGETLDALLARRPDPSADRGRFVAAFEAVCQAVAYAHARDVIHRDLKPANVMVGAFGEVQVMDWGLAKVLRPGATSDGTEPDPDATAANTEVRSLRDTPDQFTQAGSAMGTPAYMPPEQAVGAGNKVGPWSDVFGLGAILAVILTGKAPFAADTAETTRVKAAQGDVADCFARLDASGAEPGLVALCKRCLAPKPADRFPDAGEVAAAVAFFRQDAEARARQAELDRVKATTEVAEQRKRRRVQVGLAVTLLLLVAGAGAVAVWRVDEAGKARAAAQRQDDEERDRKSRTADAVAALLDQAKAALEAGDADRAVPFLDQAARRKAEGGVTDHDAWLTDYRRDLAMLRDLDRVDDFRWALVKGKYPSAGQVVERWATAFTRYGIVPGTLPVAEIAARVTSTPIKNALLAALDGWLAATAAESVRAVLATADPEPFRDVVRRLLAAADSDGLARLADRPEWLAQPSGLVRAYSTSPAVPPLVRRGLLARLVRDRVTDFGLAMELGATYPTIPVVLTTDRVRWSQTGAALRPRSAAASSVVRDPFANPLNKMLQPVKKMLQPDAPDPAGATAGRTRWYQMATALRPRSAAAANQLGNALKDSGDTDGAEASFRVAIRLDPNYAGPHHNLGLVLHDKSDLGGAEAEYLAAIRLDPNDALLHNGLSTLLREKGELDRAEAACREAIRLDPSNARAHINLGGVLYDKGNLDGAVAMCRVAIRLAPEDALPRYNLGLVLHDMGDLNGAAALFQEAIKLNPFDAYPYQSLGDVLRGKGDLDGALVAYSRASLHDFGSARPACGMASVMYDKGDFNDAARSYRHAIFTSPKDALPHNGLGNVLARTGDPHGAAVAYRNAIRLDAKFAEPHNNLGVIAESQVELAEAEAGYREAIRLNPRFAPAHANLGTVLRKQGRHADAVAAYRAALGLPPTIPAARDGLDYCLRVLRGEVPTAPPPRAVGR